MQWSVFVFPSVQAILKNGKAFMCITWLQNSTDYKADGGDDLCFKFLIKQTKKKNQTVIVTNCRNAVFEEKG